jgi:tetratricopeptide (TPR) repeat protein
MLGFVKYKLSAFVIITLMLILPFNIAVAQGSKILGIITDENGRPLKNVKVTIIDRDRKIEIVTSTNEKAKFYEIGILPSIYDLTCELKGHPKVKRSIRVHIGELKKVNIVMFKLDGLTFFKEGNYQAAIEFFQKVASNSPDCYDAFYYLGMSYLMLNNIDSAVYALGKAKKLRPDAVGVYLSLGECYLRQGSMNKASESFRDAVEAQPSDENILLIIGSIYEKYGIIDKAVSIYKKSLEMNPQLSASHYQLGRIYLEKELWEKSLFHFEQFLKCTPDDFKASQVKAVVEELRKRIKQKEND